MKSPFRAALVIILVTVAAFSNCFDGVFIFDDTRHVVHNPLIRTLWPLWKPLSETTRPLVQASLALNFAVSRLEPWSYHVVNLALHLGAALLLFGIMRRLFLRYALTRDAAVGLAMTSVTLWAIHPIQTQSVTYIIQRAECAMGLCVLGTLYCLLRASESLRPQRWLALSFAACLIGYGFKPIMAATPLIVWMFDRCFLAGGFRAAWKARRGYYMGLAASPLILPLLLAANTSEWESTAGFSKMALKWYEYAGTQPEVILHYLRLAFWPDPLCMDYGWPVQRSPAVIIVTSLVILLLMGLTLYGLRRAPALGFLGAWFFVNLAPTSSIIPILDLAFIHRMYLALATVSCGSVILVYMALLRVPPQNRRLLQTILTAGALILYGSYTFARNEDYHSLLRMTSHDVVHRPFHARAHANLAMALSMNQQYELAYREFERAIHFNPDFGFAYYEYGKLLFEQNHLQRAREALEKAAAIRFYDWTVQNALGMACFKLGDNETAIHRFSEALRLEPRAAAVHFNLGLIWKRKGDLTQATAHLEKAVLLGPGWAAPRKELMQLRSDKTL